MLEATLTLATIIRAARIESLKGDFPLDTPFTVAAAEPIAARIRARTSPVPGLGGTIGLLRKVSAGTDDASQEKSCRGCI